VQGGRDVFGGPSEFPPYDGYEVREVPYADHSFRVPAAAPLTQAEAVDLVVTHVTRWLRRFTA
jgi:hypothetical protein